MKVFLLHRDRDFDVRPGLRDEIFAAMLSGNLYAISNAKRNLERRLGSGLRGTSAQSDDALVQDLELQTLWTVMAAGDEVLYEVAKRGLPSSLIDPDPIVYRQQVLADCLAHPALIRQLYALAVETLASEREVGGLWSGAGPPYILNRSVRLLHLYLSALTNCGRSPTSTPRAFSPRDSCASSRWCARSWPTTIWRRSGNT